MENPSLIYAGNPERHDKWEKEPIKLVNILKRFGKDFNLPRPLQEVEGGESTPEKIIDIDNRALRNPDCPNIVLGRPHAGEFMPESLADRINPESADTLVLIDRGTNQIFRMPEIPSVGTKLSRFFVDPNRFPISGVTPKNPKALGMVLWEKGLHGEEIYKEGEEPTDAEVSDLVERTYLPYYNAMMGTIGTLTDRRKNDSERVLVIDGHSMMISPEFKFIWDHYEVDNPANLPLIILGDQDGASCDEDIRKAFAVALEKNFSELSQEDQDFLMRNSKSKRLVGANEYLKGVHNVAFYGQREQGVNCLQMELNESAYVDENGTYYDAQYNDRGMKLMHELVKKSCLDIDPLLKGKNEQA